MWTTRYLTEVRPGLVVPPDSKALFLTQDGEPLSPAWLSSRVRSYVTDAELGKAGGRHLFRHTCATLMLEGGADIRYIQELLGHEDLSTTEIYTQASIRRLKAVHTLTHPGAKLERLPKTALTAAGEWDREQVASSVTKMRPLARCDARDEDAKTELLFPLAEEADEEDEGADDRKQREEPEPER